MFLNKWSKSILCAIGGILECTLIENSVRAFNIISKYMYYYNTFTKNKHK